MKKCTVCKVEKTLDEFYNSKVYKDGKTYRCKPCDTAARRKSRQGEGAEKTRAGYRRRTLFMNHGLTPEQYDSMLVRQLGKCAICGTTNQLGEGNTTAKRSFSFAVDHCHASGKIRGLLCNPCNRGIGFLRDDPDVLRKAATYLEK